MDVDCQLDFDKNDLDATFKLTNTLQERLDNILQQTRKKVSPLQFPGQLIDNIPNDPSSGENIKTEDFFIDDSLREMFGEPEETLIFPKVSTDDRKDFKIDVTRNDLLVIKSPTLTSVTITKSDLKESLKI